MADDNQAPRAQPVRTYIIPPSHQEMTADQIKAIDDAYHQKAVQTWGTRAGTQPLPSGQQSPVFKGPDGTTYYVRNSKSGDRWSLDRMVTGDPNAQFEPSYVGGPEQAAEYRAQEKRLIEHPQNPFNHQAWPKPPSQMTPGELQKYTSVLDQYDNAGQGDVAGMNRNFNDAINFDQQMQHAQQLIKELGAKNLGYIAQNAEKFKEMTDQDMTDPIRQKQVDLISTLEQIGSEGHRLAGLEPKDDPTNIAQAMGKVVRGLNIPVVSAGGDILDAIAGKTFNIAKLASVMPKVDNQLRQDTTRSMINLTTEGRLPIADPLRDTIRTWGEGLDKQNIGINDNAFAKTPGLFAADNKTEQPSTEAATTETTPKPSAIPAPVSQKAASTDQTDAEKSEVTQDIKEGVPPANFGPALRAIGPQVGQFGNWLSSLGGGETQQPQTAPTPAVPSAPLFPKEPGQPGGKPLPAYEEHPVPKSDTVRPAPVQSAPLGNQTIEVSPIVPTAQNTQGAAAVPRLTQQEHVDALEPGTPFYWQDHEGAYVKV